MESTPFVLNLFYLYGRITDIQIFYREDLNMKKTIAIASFILIAIIPALADLIPGSLLLSNPHNQLMIIVLISMILF